MHRIFTSIVVCTVVAVSLQAQQSSMLDLDKLSVKASANQSSMLTGDQIPTSDVVDPAIYKVGPGDVIAFQTTGLDFSEKLTVVTPENSLMLERYGLIDVNGLTLSQLRERVKSFVADRSANIEVFLTLKKARLVYVTVEGNVPFPGTYAVPASMRIGTLITLCSQPWLLRKDQAITDQVRGLSLYSAASTTPMPKASAGHLSPYAYRNIQVRHHEGVDIVDLALAKVHGGASFNPHVCEGDVVTVPMDNGLQSTITITGAVATPTTLAFKQGDKASVLLAAAGGFAPGADPSSVVLAKGLTNETSSLEVTPEFTIVGSDPVLEAGSVITVGFQPTSGSTVKHGIVQVYGEVGKPGSVVITPGVTRIREVLVSVGGVLPKASLSLSYIVRPDLQPSTRRDASDMGYQSFMYSDLKLEDTLRFQMDQHYRVPYVSCNLEAALSDSLSAQNIVVQNGDVVVIVPKPDRVFVYGQVNQPGYVSFEPNRDIEWYVNRAGGFATGAAKSRVRIIRGNTKVWVENDDGVVVMPGDEVYAPRPPAVPAGVELQTWAMVAGILSSAAALAATVISLTR